MQLEMVIFDLDGTLLDTSSGFIRATEATIRKYGLVPIPEAKMRTFIGPPIQESFAQYYGLSLDAAHELGNAWRKIYKDQFLFAARPYDGIFDVLGFCQSRNVKTAVVTNKREDYTPLLLGHFGFQSLLDYVIGSDFEGKRSKSEMLRLCIQKMQVSDPLRCIMVGDTENDFLAAKKVGTGFLGVSYGFGFRKEEALNFADNIIMVNNCIDMQVFLSEKMD